MTDLHKLEDYTIETIESFIKNELEESIHIEFKSCGALSMEDKYKKDIAKDVSSIANSDGGIIIYGIEEKDHKAHALSFIDGDKFNKEWLEQIINSYIQRSIPDLKIFPIRKDGDIKQTIYVVQIPSSIEAPHMVTKDKENRFYRRHNFLATIMEEYEVRQSYGRKVKAELDLMDHSIMKLKKKSDGITEFTCSIGVHNIGETIEDTYKVNAYMANFPNDTSISWESHPFNRNHSYTRRNDNKFKISAASICPIYPDESLDVLRFNFGIKDELLEEAKQNASIEFVLLYSNGNIRYTTELKNWNI